MPAIAVAPARIEANSLRRPRCLNLQRRKQANRAELGRGRRRIIAHDMRRLSGDGINPSEHRRRRRQGDLITGMATKASQTCCWPSTVSYWETFKWQLRYSQLISGTNKCNWWFVWFDWFLTDWLIDRLKQDAQLSQRDRDAGCVNFGQKWKTGTGRVYFKGIIGLSSTTVA